MPVLRNVRPASGRVQAAFRARQLGRLIPILFFGLFQIVLACNVEIAEYDEAIYLNVARSICATGLPLRPMGIEGVLYVEHTPLYPYVVAGLTFVVGNNLRLLRLVTSVVGGLAVLLIGRIGARLHSQETQSPAAGWVASLLLAANPFFLVYSFFVREEVWMVLWVLLAWYSLLLEEKTSDSRYLWGAGGALAAAVLTKEIALISAAIAGSYLLACRDLSWTARLKAIAQVCLPPILAVAGWLYALWAFAPSDLQRLLMRWQSSAAGGTPDFRVSVGLSAWTQTLGGQVFSWSMLALFGVSLVIWLRQRTRRPRFLHLLVGHCLATILLSFVLTLKEPRHVITAIPAMALLIAAGPDWSTVSAWSGRRAGRRAAVTALALGVLWSIAPLQLPTPLHEWQQATSWWQPLFGSRLYRNDETNHALRETGLYLNQHTAPDIVVTVVQAGPVVAYYADRHYDLLYTRPYTTVQHILAETEFLVVDNWVFRALSEPEQVAVMAAIEETFVPLTQIRDEHRTVQIHRRYQR